MTEARPHHIKASHVARAAMIYVRQSTVAQARHNLGSTEHQRAQRHRAEAWGWPSEAIHVIDADVGLSGAGSAHRQGYLFLLEEIRAGKVGAVFASDFTRVGRCLRDWLDFLEMCLRHDVVLVDDGKIVDLADSGTLFGSKVLGLVAERENEARREHVRRGTMARVAAGKAVTAPPVGYVSQNGDWFLDPDVRIRDAISAVFRLFPEQRSCARAVRELDRLGMLLPRRQPGRPLRWEKATIGIVRQFLKNPRYAGRYPYREHVTDVRLGRNKRGQPKLRRSRADELIVIEDHHPGYVTVSQWDEIQAILRLRAPSAERRSPGPGSALLQGLVACGMHRCRTMSVGYRAMRRGGTRRHYYYCSGDYPAGGRQCGHTSGKQLDAMVIDAFLQRLQPVGLEAIREAWTMAKDVDAEGVYLVQSCLNQARQRRVELERRYELVNVANRRVVESVERKLEDAIAEVERLEGEVGAAKVRPPIISEEAFDDLIALAGDVDRLFYASTTTNEERKELIRSMIHRVVVEGRSPGCLVARIQWCDERERTRVEGRRAS